MDYTVGADRAAPMPALCRADAEAPSPESFSILAELMSPPSPGAASGIRRRRRVTAAGVFLLCTAGLLVWLQGTVRTAPPAEAGRPHQSALPSHAVAGASVANEPVRILLSPDPAPGALIVDERQVVGSLTIKENNAIPAPAKPERGSVRPARAAQNGATGAGRSRAPGARPARDRDAEIIGAIVDGVQRAR